MYRLDYFLNIELNTHNPPLNNLHALYIDKAGLFTLANIVRSLEIEYIQKDPYAKYVVLHTLADFPPIIACAFNWFSVTLINYLRLVALVDLMQRKSWKSEDLKISENRSIIKNHCRNYVKEIVPQIYMWRNKIAAHAAATDPFGDDNLGVLEYSVMNLLSYTYPYFLVGDLQFVANTEVSSFEKWSLTQTFEDLAPRFWPDLKLQQLLETE